MAVIMKVMLSKIAPYEDERNNVILCDETIAGKIRIVFKGSNNTLKVKQGASIISLVALFDSHDGYLEIGSCDVGGKRTGLKAHARAGFHSQIIVGNNVTCTSVCALSAVEKSR